MSPEAFEIMLRGDYFPAGHDAEISRLGTTHVMSAPPNPIARARPARRPARPVHEARISIRAVRSDARFTA
jgi:hypothetical protein